MYEFISVVIVLLIYILFDYRAWKRKKFLQKKPAIHKIINDHFDLLDSSCTCHTGHPPCSFCVDTFDCDVCNMRNYASEIEEETEWGFLCYNCVNDQQRKQNKKTIIIAVIVWIIFIAIIYFTYHNKN